MVRIKPRLGDALVVDYNQAEFYTGMVAAIAKCECGGQVYTAVSGSAQSARRIIYRKHVAHLKACSRQAELFALD